MSFLDYDDRFDCSTQEQCSDCEYKYNLFETAQRNLERVIRILYKDKNIDIELLQDSLEQAYDSVCQGIDHVAEFPTNKLDLARSKNLPTYLNTHISNLKEILI